MPPNATYAEQPLSDLDTAAIEMAAQFLNQNLDLEEPSSLTLSLGQHLRRMFNEALRTQPMPDGTPPKRVKELMQEAHQDIVNAISDNDGSLDQLIDASRLREQARTEQHEASQLGIIGRWRTRRIISKVALQSITPHPTLNPKSVEL